LVLAGCAGNPDPVEEVAAEPEVIAVAPEPEVVEEPEEVELTEEDVRTLVFPAVFDSTRLGFIEIIGDVSSVESVDSYLYDPETGTVQLDATSVYGFAGNIRDTAWEITRLFGAGVYSPIGDDGSWLSESPRFAPALRITLSSEVGYDCDGDTMRLLGEVKLSRDEWESICRIR
jgi:hypothetical protein